MGWREHGVGLLQKDVRPIAEKQLKNLLRDIVHCLRPQQKQAALKLELLSAECKRKEDWQEEVQKNHFNKVTMLKREIKRGQAGFPVPSITPQKPRESITHPATTLSHQIPWQILAEHACLKDVLTSSPQVSRENFPKWETQRTP